LFLPVKAVIFDVDDTLIDLSSAAYPHHCDTARALGLPVPSREAFASHWGGSTWPGLVAAVWPMADVEKFLETYRRLHGYSRVTVREGTLEGLNQLRSAGLVLGVLTGKHRHAMLEHFKSANFDTSVFDFLLTADETAFHKPDPRCFDEALALLQGRGIGKSRVVYVGDSLHDFSAARGAGLGFVGVEGFATARKAFESAGVENVVSRISELPPLLANGTF
jgi:phosphoglycolate phosphatase